LRIYHLCMQPSYPGQLSLAIPPWVGKMSTGDDYHHSDGRNGEFCVTVGPVTRTADILTQSVRSADC